VSRVNQPLHAFADLFCRYCDEIDGDAVRRDWRDWEADVNWRSLKEAMRSDVEHRRPVNNIIMRVDNGAERAKWMYAALRGIDEAFVHVNPALRGAEPIPRELLGLEAHVAARGRLDSGAHGGALIPRLVRRNEPAGEVEHLRDLFVAVQRVPADSWRRCEVEVLGGAVALDPPDLVAGIDIACVPVIADPDELHFDVRTDRGRRLYRIGPADVPATRARIPEIVAALDRSGALIAFAPEATLTPRLLERWQESLRPRRGSRLRWVLAGTGRLPGLGGSGNTAVMLDGRTGAVIGRQDKLYPFNLSAHVLERWKLGSRLGAAAVAEDLTAIPRRLTVFEAGGARFAILICEDLNRLLDIGPLIRDLGISHLVVPVFSRPIQPHRWEQTAAAAHARETGTTVIVCNSLVMAAILGTKDPGTSLVYTPAGERAVVGRSRDAARPVCFRLLPDGAVELG
jgi:predicted amidohydrolase